MAEWMGGSETVSIAQLQKELEEKDEELREWKVKCMRAEAEVRALKKQTKHAQTLQHAPPVIHERSTPHERSSPQNRVVEHTHFPWPTFPVSDSLDATPTRPSQPTSPTSRSVLDVGVQMNAEAPATASEAVMVASLRQELQSMEQQKTALETSLESHEEFRATCESQERGAAQSQEVQELRQQLSQRSQAMMQLQSDMVKDKQTVDRQRKEAEILYKEELLEMTQRAKSLSEQAKNSRKRATELQAARDEVTTLRADVEECEARLSSQELEKAKLLESEAMLTSELASSSTEAQAVRREQEALSDKLEQRNFELRAVSEASAAADTEKPVLDAIVAREASEAEQQPDLKDASPTAEPEEAGAARLKVMECISSVRQLFADLQSDTTPAASSGSREVGRSPRKPRDISGLKSGARGLSRGAAKAKAAPDGPDGQAASSSANKEVMARLARQLGRLQQLVEGPEGEKGFAGQQGRAAAAGGAGGHAAGGPAAGGHAAVRAVSPEGEHPPPEQDRRMYQQLSVDANEMMQQQLNDYRVAAEQTQEEMMVQHCEELDDLVRRHDRERRDLHNEIRDLRAECAAKADGSASGLADVASRGQSEQLAMMKRELVAQLADFHQRETEQRGTADREISQLRKNLEESTKELSASQEEFEVLSELFDNMRRDKQQLEAANRVLELGCQAATEVSTIPSLQTDKADKALIATAYSSYDMTPEDTGIWDYHAALNAVPEQLGLQVEHPKAHERVSSVHSDRLVASVGSIEKIPETPHRTASPELVRQHPRGPSGQENPAVLTSPGAESAELVTPKPATGPARVAAPSRHSGLSRISAAIAADEAVGMDVLLPQPVATPNSPGPGMQTPTPSLLAGTPTVSVIAPSAGASPGASPTTVLRAGSRSSVSSALNFSPEGVMSPSTSMTSLKRDITGASMSSSTSLKTGTLTPQVFYPGTMPITGGAIATLSSPRTASPTSSQGTLQAAATALTVGPARGGLRMSGQPVFERRGT